jgi:hypothetical protein
MSNDNKKKNLERKFILQNSQGAPNLKISRTILNNNYLYIEKHFLLHSNLVLYLAVNHTWT